MATKLGNQSIRQVIWLIVAVAALNIGLAHFAGFDLITDLLFEAGTTEYTATVAIITAAAAVNLYNQGVALMGGR